MSMCVLGGGGDVPVFLKRVEVSSLGTAVFFRPPSWNPHPSQASEASHVQRSVNVECVVVVIVVVVVWV